jgi:WD40 repeat protein
MIQHPVHKYLVFSCLNGNVFIWTLESPFLTSIKEYKEEDGYISCLGFSPCGYFLVAGTSKGNILIKKEDQKFFGSASLLVSQKKKKVSCKKIEFSPNGKHFAIMDDRRCVSLFKLVENYGEVSQTKDFVFVGKLMSHTAAITDIKFAYKKQAENKKGRENSIKIKNSGFKQGTTQENSENFAKVQAKEEVLMEKNQNINQKIDSDVTFKEELFLYSIGKDCFLTEYNIDKSKDNLQVESFQRIENQYEPLSLLFMQTEAQETQLIISNSGYKLKIWESFSPTNTQSDKFKCIKTQLGPVYGYPINKMQKISLQGKNEQPEDYIIYSTESKVIGLIKLPLNGNPNKWMGLVAHSNKINCFLSDSNQNKVFTAGNEDLNLCIWDIDVDKVQSNPLFQKELTDPLEIVPQFFEGGRKGKIFSDLENFFYYSQIRRKEENVTKAHKLDGKIPLQEISNLITALGFYSTQLEIDNIQNEVLKQKQSENTNLKLGEFIKLFINHKPVYGLEYQELQKAFKCMTGGNDKIKRELFIEILTKSGEIFTKENCETYLNALTGLNEFEEMLPDEFDLNMLLFDILGFENIN